MKVLISSEVLTKQGLTLQDFGVLLYYMGRGLGDIHPEITRKLWEKNFLRKEIDGYAFNGSSNKLVQEWFIQSEDAKDETTRMASLAEALRAIYPAGTKYGTNYMWRDSTMTITKKLKDLAEMCRELGIKPFTDEQVIEATKRYVASFNGDFRYMQLLKYFILKNDREKTEKSSQLLSFIQNESVEPTLNFGFDNGEIR